MAIIGIDLGTTNSLAAVMINGRVQLIPNALGEYLTPSVVSFDQNGEVFVGRIAKEMLITRPESTFCEFKRNMGTNHVYSANGKEYRAEDLSAFVLRRLKEDAERYLGEPVTEAVISVPAYFNDDKRCATRNAGLLAGLKVERLINEPSAVALKHHIEQNQMESFIIFDFGGGTLDVSLVETFDNIVEIHAVSGDNYLGGKDFNEIIAEEFCRKTGLNRQLLSPEEWGILLKESELLKMDLSRENEASREFFLQDASYTMRLTNQQLIHISRELFNRMSKPIKQVMNDSGSDWNSIDKVILVGGSSKMPVVRQYIKSISKVPVAADEQPDESIALGVGMAAAIKERTGDIKDMILADICPFSLGTEIYDGTFSPIIERNDSLPCRRTERYVTVQDYQMKMTFHIYQGENLVAKDNLLLGTMEITDVPPLPKGQACAMVTFLYDINGILDIKIDSENQSIHKVIFNKNIGLTENEVNERVKELQNTALHPFGKERNRLLLERAQRMYMESRGSVRDNLSMLIRRFESILQAGSEQDIRQEYVSLSLFLEALENRGVTFEEFDESFWNEDGEDLFS